MLASENKKANDRMNIIMEVEDERDLKQAKIDDLEKTLV